MRRGLWVLAASRVRGGSPTPAIATRRSNASTNNAIPINTARDEATAFTAVLLAKSSTIALAFKRRISTRNF